MDFIDMNFDTGLARAVLSATLPVFLLVALGAGLRRIRLLSADGWAAIDRIVYFVLFPALLFRAVATAQLQGAQAVPMAAALIAATVIMAVLVWLAGWRLRTGRPVLGVMLMGAVRFNTFLGVAIAERLMGPRGLALTALCIAALVPTVNILSVLTLPGAGGGAGGGKGGRSVPARIGGVLRALLTNPLILACAAGGAVNRLDLLPPPEVMEAVDIAGRASLAIGLIAVGAGLEFAALTRRVLPLLTGTVVKLILFPALGAGTLVLAGLDGQALLVGVMWLALPSAPSSYVMARAMGGDAALMAGLLTAQLLFGLATLPVWLLLFA